METTENDGVSSEQLTMDTTFPEDPVILMTTKKERECSIVSLRKVDKREIDRSKVVFERNCIVGYGDIQHQVPFDNPYVEMELRFSMKDSESHEICKERATISFQLDGENSSEEFQKNMNLVSRMIWDVFNPENVRDCNRDFSTFIQTSLCNLQDPVYDHIKHLQVKFGNDGQVLERRANCGMTYHQRLDHFLMKDVAPLLREFLMKKHGITNNSKNQNWHEELHRKLRLENKYEDLFKSQKRKRLLKSVDYVGLELFDLILLFEMIKMNSLSTEEKFHIANLEFVSNVLRYRSTDDIHKAEFMAWNNYLVESTRHIRTVNSIPVRGQKREIPKEWDLADSHAVYGHALIFHSKAMKENKDLQHKLQDDFSNIDIFDHEKYKVFGKTAMKHHSGPNDGICIDIAGLEGKENKSKDLEAFPALGVIFTLDLSTDIHEQMETFSSRSKGHEGVLDLISFMKIAREQQGLAGLTQVLILCQSMDVELHTIYLSVTFMKEHFKTHLNEIKRELGHWHTFRKFCKFRIYINCHILDSVLRHHNTRQLTQWITQTWNNQTAPRPDSDPTHSNPTQVQLESFLRIIQKENLSSDLTHISVDDFKDVFLQLVEKKTKEDFADFTDIVTEFYSSQPKRRGDFFYHRDLCSSLKDKLIFDFGWMVSKHEGSMVCLPFTTGQSTGALFDVMRFYVEVQVVSPHDLFTRQDQIIRRSHDLTIHVPEILPIATCSIGFVQVSKGWRGNGEGNFKHGTCFAIGDGFILTAYHNIREVLTFVEEKAWLIDGLNMIQVKRLKKNRNEWLNIWQKSRNFDNEKSNKLNEKIDRCQKKTRVTWIKNGVPMLLVNVDLRSCFFDETLDIAIFSTFGDHSRRIVHDIELCKGNSAVKHGHIKAFPRVGDERPFLLDCKLNIHTYEEASVRIKQAKSYFTPDYEEKAAAEKSDLLSTMKNCRKKDKENGHNHVYLSCSKTIGHGASGGPVFVHICGDITDPGKLFTHENCRNVVYAMLLRGVPSVMSVASKKLEQLKDKVGKCQYFMYEKCVKMTAVYDLLINHDDRHQFPFIIVENESNTCDTWSVRRRNTSSDSNTSE